MSVEDQGEMIRVLQQKMQEMQQRHEEEMAAVRVECSARIAKGKGLETGERAEGEHDKTVTGKRPNTAAHRSKEVEKEIRPKPTRGRVR